MTPEERLLLACVTGEKTDPVIRDLAAAPLDLAHFVALAEREQASAPVWGRLRAVVGDGHPIALALEPFARVSDFQMMTLEERFLSGVQLLRDHGIESVALKGAAIAAAVHGAFVKRPMGDVDILISPDEIDRAAALLLGAGWIWSPQTPDVDDYRMHHHTKPLADPSGSARDLELHRSLFVAGHPFALTPEKVVERSYVVRMQDVDVRVPHLTHRLLHSCLHFAWSNTLSTGAWKTFRDLDAMISREQVDWEDFLRTARESRARTCCYWPLRLASSLIGVEVPADVLRALAPRTRLIAKSVLERHLTAGLFSNERACPSVRLTKFLWKAAVQPRAEGHRGILPWHASDPGMDSANTPHLIATIPWHGRAMRLSAWFQYGRAIFA